MKCERNHLNVEVSYIILYSIYALLCIIYVYIVADHDSRAFIIDLARVCVCVCVYIMCTRRISKTNYLYTYDYFNFDF